VDQDAERWERVKSLFQTALDRPTADRPAFLRDACGADLDLLAEMESLLDAHASAGSFAVRPAVDWLSPKTSRTAIESASRVDPVLLCITPPCARGPRRSLAGDVSAVAPRRAGI
jgi:hypothetical protein